MIAHAQLDDIIMWTTTYINTSEDMFFRHYGTIFNIPFSHVITCGLTGERACESGHVTDRHPRVTEALFVKLAAVNVSAESVLLIVHLPLAAAIFRVDAAIRLLNRATIIILSQVYNDSLDMVPYVTNFIYELNYNTCALQHRHDPFVMSKVIRWITAQQRRARLARIEQWQDMTSIRLIIREGRIYQVNL